MTKLATAAGALAAGLIFCLGLASAQEPAPKDDALDKLLEKIDETKAEAPRPAPAEEKPAPAVGEKKADPDAKPAAPGAGGEPEAPKDKALDSLLEKLGETKDEPAADEPAGGKPGPGEPPPDRPAMPGKEGLEGKTKKLDEHLEELTGRKRKDPNKPKSPSQGQDKSPLTDAIKKMDEVEERLRKTDTGSQTRKTQGEIVKQLDQILEQIRQQSGSGQMGRRIQQAGTKGNKPGGQQPSDQPGNNAQGAGPMRPLRPTAKSVLANNKDTWGDLPPNLREEMENSFKEESLPSKQQLVNRYFLTVSKKSLAPKE